MGWSSLLRTTRKGYLITKNKNTFIIHIIASGEKIFSNFNFSVNLAYLKWRLFRTIAK